MPGVICRELVKSFGANRVIDNLSLEVRSGELFSLLGPSGCGKSTLLRMIAGLEHPEGGSIRIGDEDVTGVPPYRRGIGMVFQQYALFPHMTVGENVRFGLEATNVPRAEQQVRVVQALAMVQLEAFSARYPHELSGGQQQRVAVARALATQPAIVLLDEPLSNLDAKLRQEIRSELRALHRSLGVTMIHVTHDQEEALSISDRIAVIFRGRIAQLGTPETLYHAPVSVEVAGFLGELNVLDARVGPPPRSAGSVLFRPERARVSAVAGDGALHIPGSLRERVFAGPSVRLTVQPDDTGLPPVTVVVDHCALSIGERVVVSVAAGDVIRIPAE